MHPDTCAALRLLVLALENHPADLQTLTSYIDGELFADLIEDYVEDSDDDEEEEG